MTEEIDIDKLPRMRKEALAKRRESDRKWRTNNPEKRRESDHKYYTENKEAYALRDARRRAAEAKALPLRWMRGATIGEQSRNLEELYRRADAHAEARTRGDKSIGLKCSDLLSPGFKAMQDEWLALKESVELLFGKKMTIGHMQPLSKLGEDSMENWLPMTDEQQKMHGTKLWPDYLATIVYIFEDITLLSSEPIDPNPQLNEEPYGD